MNNKNIDFRFQTDRMELIKAKTNNGDEVLKMCGIASKEEEDAQGDTLLIEGLLLDQFVGSYVNWLHNANKPNGASSIVGVVSKAEKRKKELYVEIELFPELALAQDIYNLAKILEKRGKKNLEFSIEGRALERDPMNNGIVTKSKLTGLAICPHGINRSTFAQIMKGETDGLNDLEFETTIDPNGGATLIVDMVDESGNRITVDSDYNLKVEKAMSTASASAVIPESLEGKEKKLVKSFFINDENINFTSKLEKSQVYDYFYKAIPDITLDASKRLFSTIVSLKLSQGSTMPEQEITLEDINKAFDNIKLLSQIDSENLSKGMKMPDEKTQGGKMTTLEKMTSMIEKGCSKEEIMKAIKEDEEEEGVSDEDMEKMYESNFGKKKNKMEKSEPELTVEEKIQKAEAELELLKAEASKEVEPKEEIQKSEAPNVDELIKGLQDSFVEKISGLEVLVKGVVSSNEDLKGQVSAKEEELKKAEETLRIAKEQYDNLANAAKLPKSIQSQSWIEKGESPEGEFSSAEKISVRNKKEVLTKADSFIDYSAIEAGDKLEKSYAESLDKYQFSDQVPPQMVKRFKENGIELVP